MRIVILVLNQQTRTLADKYTHRDKRVSSSCNKALLLLLPFCNCMRFQLLFREYSSIALQLFPIPTTTFTFTKHAP